MRNKLAFAFILLLMGCARQEGSWPTLKAPSDSAIRLNSISLTRIELDSVYCSGAGFSGMCGPDEIGYFDKYLCYLYSFNITGNLLDRKFGFGNGPSEISMRRVQGCDIHDNGVVTAFGSNLDVSIMREGTSKQTFTIPFNPEDPDRGKGEAFTTYSRPSIMDLKLSDEYLYYRCESQHPEFNLAVSASSYLTDSRHLVRVNLKDPRGEMLIKGYPQPYHDSPREFMSVSMIRYDLLPDGFIVGFEATPELYVCNMDGMPIRVFGVPGREMDQSYFPVRSLDADEISNHYLPNRENKGYYSTIKVIGPYVFRSYKKGDHKSVDGLQIYEDEILIADLDVPKGMEVIGLVGSTVISNVFYDETLNKLFCYEFDI